jgi:hypothetical protein
MDKGNKNISFDYVNEEARKLLQTDSLSEEEYMPYIQYIEANKW